MLAPPDVSFRSLCDCTARVRDFRGSRQKRLTRGNYRRVANNDFTEMTSTGRQNARLNISMTTDANETGSGADKGLGMLLGNN